MVFLKEAFISTKEVQGETATPKQAAAPTVRFDDTGITNSYSNVCNISSSREEVVLVFGMNNAWERDAGEGSGQAF